MLTDIIIKIIHDNLPMICHRFYHLSYRIIHDHLLMISFKVLSLIQSWAHAFSPDPDLRGVAEVILAHCLGSLYSTAKILIVDGQVYMDLKRKGVEFPTPSDEDLLLVQSRQPATVCF